MKLTCEVTRTDFLAFNINFARTWRSFQVLVLIMFAYFAYNGFNSVDDENTSVVIALVVGILMGLIFLSVFVPSVLIITAIWIYTMPRSGKNKALLGRHEYEIREEGLMNKTAVLEQMIKFHGVERLVSTKRHLFVYIGTFQAYIIPRRGILQGDLTAFEHELRKRVDEAVF